jgi:hypothetical protein
MIVTVDVTHKTITDGTRRNGTRCPVALGLRPHINTETLFSVHRTGIFLTDGMEYCRVDVPEETGKLIDLFDDGWTISPFSFELDIPEWALA